ncbi:nitroreductase family protein [Amycolatopsis tolypomycina]|uniref:Nitroreductase family protein n=1 Tax=Amycolatopsis tolypomycina TaxID=208445 RepID=A0A1H4U3J1_9PSEU|nr:nitroreductase family protein [Amycolatopsis tolypomycina]SEC63257.1 Nitroreductase family protein [Amycolatopsis tolypomycina]
MERRIPDTATVESAVALALRAPSARNAQPWCWRIGYSTLHLFADEDRPLPAPGERDVLLGCGAALHHVRVAFAALGWSAEVQRLPDPDDPAHLAVVTPRPAGRPREETTALAAAIPRRRTDRRPPAVWPVPRAHLDALARAATREGARLEVVTGSVRHGMDGRPGTLLTRPAALGTGGEVLVVATASDDRMALLRAGEATSAVLLSATALGLASCPLTASRDTQEEFARTTPAYPQALVRVGWAAPGSAPLPPTPRRRLGHVLEPLQAPPKYHHRLLREEA